MPLVYLQDTILFPLSIMSVYIHDEKSKKSIKEACKTDKLALFSCLQDSDQDSEKVYQVGCVGFIMRVKELQDKRIKILIRGLKKASIESCKNNHVSLIYCSKKNLLDKDENNKIALNEMKASLSLLAKAKQTISPELVLVLTTLNDPENFCNMLLNHFDLKTKDLQKALEMTSVKEKIKMTKKVLDDEIQIFKLQNRIKNLLDKNAETSVTPFQNKMQKLDNQSKKEEIKEYQKQIQDKDFPQEVQKVISKQLERLEKMHSESSEASIIRNYLDWIIDLPWTFLSTDNTDLIKAQNILNEDHFDLLKVKERILEFLAVCQLKTNKSPQGSILCFSGPPGVGKTSLGKSIAKAMGRKYHRISLGGIKDESEIRGHRKTYVGAMPGKIIQALKDCGTKNPVIVLDEVDKLCSDMRGDPSSALLEVLDPKQNHSFRDHYLNLNFDLSKIFFIATANAVHKIPPALKDRLEIVQISGYTINEKKQIATKHLIKNGLKDHGLGLDHVQFTDGALENLISFYTKEAGLRNLNRQLSAVFRKVAKKCILGDSQKKLLDKKNLIDILGTPLFRKEKTLDFSKVGIATGLAWTEAGGEILYIEAIKIKNNKPKLILTGQLGDVMKESVKIALSFVRSYVQKLQIDIEKDWFDKHEIHVHLPAGAIPKDGPSAGITMVMTLFSLVTGIPIKNTIAMTGEVSLSGKVLPVGGVKEKILAAFYHGIKHVVLPEQNKKDLEELPQEIRQSMRFSTVSHLEEVFKQALIFESIFEKIHVKASFENKEIDKVA